MTGHLIPLCRALEEATGHGAHYDLTGGGCDWIISGPARTEGDREYEQPGTWDIALTIAHDARVPFPEEMDDPDTQYTLGFYQHGDWEPGDAWQAGEHWVDTDGPDPRQVTAAAIWLMAKHGVGPAAALPDPGPFQLYQYGSWRERL